MRWAWLVIFTLWMAASTASASDTEATGSIQATARSPQLVSVSPNAIVRDGHTITITVTGQVDINQERRSRRRCGFLGVSCKRIYWTEHHWVSAREAPVRIEIRGRNGGAVVRSITVTDQPAVISLPVTNGSFAREYEIVGVLAGAGSSVDPDRSAGAYSVSLEIDGLQRAQAYSNWLNQTRPTAEQAIAASATDRALLDGRAEIVAKAFRDYAGSRYPVSEPEGRPQHEALVRRAVEIAPQDPANAFALAQYFRAVGLNAAADQALNDVIARLQSREDPQSRRLLGEAYMVRASAVLEQGGGVDPASITTAAAYLQQAVTAMNQSGRRDLEANALVTRGLLLRGLRSPAALSEAVKSLERALMLTAENARGRSVYAAPSGQSAVAIDWTYGYRLALTDGSPAGELRDGAIALRWDPVRQRILELDGETFQWRDRDGQTSPGPLVANFMASVANGAVLAQTREGAANYVSADNVVIPIQFGASSTCANGGMPAGRGTASLGPTGDTVVTFCQDTLRFLKFGQGALVQDGEVGPLGVLPFSPPQVYAGQSNCGAVLVSSAGYYGATPSAKLVKADGRQFDLALPPVPASPGSVGGFNPMGFQFPPEALFTPDGRIFLIRPRAPISVFRCSDGVSLGEIIVPIAPLEMAQEVTFMSSGRTAAAVDEESFAVFDWQAKRFSIIAHGQGDAVTDYPFPPSLAGIDAAFMGQFFLPPASPGAPNRFVQFVRQSTVRDFTPNLGGTRAVTTLPVRLGETYLLEGGRYLLTSDDTIGRQFLVDLNTGVREVVLAAPDGSVRPAPEADGWSVVRSGPNAAEAIDVYRGSTRASSVALPDPPVELLAPVVDYIEGAIAAGWAPAVAGEPGGPTQFFNPNQFALLLSERDRISIRWAWRPSMKALGGPQPEAWLFCSVPMGRDSLDRVSQLPFSSTDGLLANRLAGELTFSPAGNACEGNLVSGAVPTFLRSANTPAGLELSTLRDNTWIKAGLLPRGTEVLAASGTADGGQLLLVTEGTPNGQRFSIVRIPVSGSLGPACSGCTSMDLVTAQARLTAALSKGDRPSLEASEISDPPPTITLMVDSTGTLLARPDGDDTVVQSLVTGQVLLRVQLAVPVQLTADTLVVTTGHGRLQIHPLKMPPP